MKMFGSYFILKLRADQMWSSIYCEPKCSEMLKNAAHISLNHRLCSLINHTKPYCVSGYILIKRAALTLTWEWCEVRVLVAPVCVTTHGVNPRVVLVGGRADEGPVAWDQLDVADAPALLRGDAARSSDGHVAQAVCGTRVVRAPVTVAL